MWAFVVAAFDSDRFAVWHYGGLFLGWHVVVAECFAEFGAVVEAGNWAAEFVLAEEAWAVSGVVAGWHFSVGIDFFAGAVFHGWLLSGRVRGPRACTGVVLVVGYGGGVVGGGSYVVCGGGTSMGVPQTCLVCPSDSSHVSLRLGLFVPQTRFLWIGLGDTRCPLDMSGPRALWISPRDT